MAGDPSRRALLAAAEVIARVMKKVAAVKTDETADAVNIGDEGDHLTVNAGYPTGPWRWTPIQAWMFDDGGMHPLFGDRSHWYRQPLYPITEITERASIGDAANAYADVMIQWAEDELS